MFSMLGLIILSSTATFGHDVVPVPGPLFMRLSARLIWATLTDRSTVQSVTCYQIFAAKKSTQEGSAPQKGRRSLGHILHRGVAEEGVGTSSWPG